MKLKLLYVTGSATFDDQQQPTWELTLRGVLEDVPENWTQVEAEFERCKLELKRRLAVVPSLEVPAK